MSVCYLQQNVLYFQRSVKGVCIEVYNLTKQTKRSRYYMCLVGFTMVHVLCVGHKSVVDNALVFCTCVLHKTVFDL